MYYGKKKKKKTEIKLGVSKNETPVGVCTNHLLKCPANEEKLASTEGALQLH